ncbi:MAG TPA: MlaD family protein [Bacteroidia bacterium]|nr:MlaD family protein [Bacteroidia bacterium]
MAIKKEVKTGILAVVALGMMIYGLNFLKGINMFSKTKKVYAVYTDVQGIVPANPVMVNGFRVGQVNDIEIRPDATGKIVITMLITNTDVKIPKNSVAKIFSDGLLGSKAITLDLGNSADYIKDGDTLKSSVEQSIKDQVSQQVLPLKAKAEELISSIDSTVAIVQGIFNLKTRNNLSQSIESINISLKNLSSTTGSLDDLMTTQKKTIADILGKIDEIAGALAKNSKQLGNAINNFSTISDSLAKANLKGTINNADSALYYTAQLLEKINKGKGSLGMLANDSTLYKRLSGASDNLGKLLEDMRLHPQRYVHFSLFGKKDN